MTGSDFRGGGVLRDSHGRQIFTTRGEGDAPDVGDVKGAGTVFDSEGREHIVIVDKNGNPLSAGSGGSSGLTPTAVKTANYTAASGDLVRVDTTSGARTITLPAAAAGATVGVKLVTLGAGNTVTIAAAGSDVFNKAGGPTTLSLTLLNQGVVLAADSGVWVVQSDDLALSQLDTRYGTTSVQSPALPAAVGQVPVSLTTTDRTVAWTASGYSVVAYGAKADAVTLWTGAMTSGSAVLTDTSAPFTSADVGKVCVVNNALGAGVHLYTTILSFTDSSHVTLAASATATVATALYTYGTDDLAAWNAALAAVPSGGQIVAPPTASLVRGAVNISKPCTVQGSGVSTTNFVVPSLVANAPVVAPFLVGSVLVQASSGADGFAGTANGVAVHFRGIGVRFAGAFTNTGHGFNFSGTSNGASGYNAGLLGANWENVAVFGHDVTHWGYYLRNPLLCHLSHALSYGGGGGFCLDQNSNLYTYGNTTLTAPYAAQYGGAKEGYLLTSTFGFIINLVAMVRPQAIRADVGTTFNAWGLSNWTGRDFDGTGATDVVLVAPDMESNTVRVGPRTEIVSASQWFGVESLADTAPFHRLLLNRRINADGSVSLDSVETSGSSLWLLRNNANAGKVWGLTTDGTDKFLWPGRIDMSGSGPANPPTVGAAIGTSPPVARVSGTDMAGSVVFGSGTGPTTGSLVTVTFSNGGYSAAPVVVITPKNAATAALGLYATPSTTGFVVGCTVAPSASQASGVYAFSYTVMGGLLPAAAAIVYDDFTRADSASSLGSATTGQAWTVRSGTWGISSNRAYLASGSTGIATQDITVADYVLDCEFPVLGSANIGVIVRYIDTTNYLLAASNTIYQVTAGTFNVLKTYTAIGTTDHLTIVCQGSKITVKVNGNVVAIVSSTQGQSSTIAGLRTDNATSRYDNFAAG